MSDPWNIAQRPRASSMQHNTAPLPLTASSSVSHMEPTASSSPSAPSRPQYSNTPPYTSGEERTSAPHTPARGYPARSNLSRPNFMPPLYSFSPRTPHPTSSPSIPPFSSPLYTSTPSASTSTSSPQQFGIYPHSYPSSNVYPPFSTPQYTDTTPSSPWRTEGDSNFDAEMFFDPEALVSASETASTSTAAPASGSNPSKTARVPHTPRPPNAWILYRSDKLKAIAAGEHLPGLEAIMAEAGLSNSGTELSEESCTEDKNKIAGSMLPPPTPKKKAKKGAKEPSEGLLSLGRGKTGRGLPQADISKMISMLWKRESAEVRSDYERMSEMRKLQHQEKYPGYKFQPLRKADKIKIREEREREKEAAKREKEMTRSGGRSRRLRMSRPIISPTSPYSIGITERQPGTDGGNSLSSPGPAVEGIDEGTQIFWAGMSGGTYAPSQTGVSEPLSMADYRFRSYPFPMPPGSLPSLAPDTPVGSTSLNAEAKVTDTERPARPQSFSHSSPLIPPHLMPPDTTQSSPAHQFHSSPQVRFQPSPKVRPHSPHPHPVHQAANVFNPSKETQTPAEAAPDAYPAGALPGWPAGVPFPPPEGFPQPFYQDYPGVGEAYAIPYLFETIPLSPSHDPGGSDPQAPVETGDPDSLEAMWCLLEETGATPPAMRHEGDAGAGPSRLREEIAAWNQDPEQAVENWAHTGADENDSVFANIELSSNVAARLAADWATRQPASQPSQPSKTQLYDSDQVEPNFPTGFYQASYDPSASYPFLQMAQYDPTLGPFLPFSPIDAAFLRPSNNANDQSESQGRSLSISSASTPSQLPIPRHISASAYPPTPLSVDPHNLQRDGVWTDRQASFAAAAVGETVHTAAEDTLWEEGMAEGTGVKGEEGQSGNPRLAALGMMSVRRARTVGGSFGEAAGDVAE